MCQCSAHLVMISQRESYRRAQASGSDNRCTNRPEFPEPHKSHGRATSWPINPEWAEHWHIHSCCDDDDKVGVQHEEVGYIMMHPHFAVLWIEALRVTR